MKKGKFANVIKRVCACLCALLLGFPWGNFSAVLPVYAEDERSFDYTYVEDDLKEDDGSEPWKELPFVENAAPSLYLFAEYCYSENALIRAEKYGLYVYIYNPGAFTFNVRTGANAIQLATTYDDQGEPIDYEKFDLKYCDHTSGEYDKLIYKFRVLGISGILANVVPMDEANGKRRYDIVGVELQTDTEKLPVDYGVSWTYYCSGYAKGCGSTNDESTLTVERKELETVSLELKHANYRHSFIGNIADDLNTVYFSVPEKYFTKYGNLQKIKAEWYEYKTSYQFVTSDSDCHVRLSDFIGVNIGDHTDLATLPDRVFWEEEVDYQEPGAMVGIQYSYSKGYNGEVEALNNSGADHKFHFDEDYKAIPRMDWLFLQSGVTTRDGYKVPRSRVIEYMDKIYPSIVKDTSQNLILGRYGQNLFVDSIDEDRIQYLVNPADKRGYVVQEIDAGQMQNLIQQKDQSWWDEFWHGVKTENLEFSPIVDLAEDKAKILAMDASLFASTYLIGSQDKDQVFADVKAMLEAGEHAILFRFAVTDYYASTARFDTAGDRYGLGDLLIAMSDPDGYVAQQTVFLNFDIITLTFRKDDVEKVIGVVASPIDIINGLDPPPDLDVNKGCNLWAVIAYVIVIILVVWAIKGIGRVREKYKLDEIYRNTRKK